MVLGLGAWTRRRTECLRRDSLKRLEGSVPRDVDVLPRGSYERHALPMLSALRIALPTAIKCSAFGSPMLLYVLCCRLRHQHLIFTPPFFAHCKRLYRLQIGASQLSLPLIEGFLHSRHHFCNRNFWKPAPPPACIGSRCHCRQHACKRVQVALAWHDGLPQLLCPRLECWKVAHTTINFRQVLGALVESLVPRAPHHSQGLRVGVRQAES